MNFIRVPIYKELRADFEKRLEIKTKNTMKKIKEVNGHSVSDIIYQRAFDRKLNDCFYHDDFNRAVGWIEIILNKHGFSFRLHKKTNTSPKGNVKRSDKPERAFKIVLPDVNIGWGIKNYPSMASSEIEAFLIKLIDSIVSDVPFENCIYDENEIRDLCKIINWPIVIEM